MCVSGRSRIATASTKFLRRFGIEWEPVGWMKESFVKTVKPDKYRLVVDEEVRKALKFDGKRARVRCTVEVIEVLEEGEEGD